MDISITIDARFNAVKRAMELRGAELDAKVNRLMDDIADIAERWVRREAPRKTGRLKSATRHEGRGTHRRVFVSKNVAPYFEYVIDGTRPHTIVPKYKQALAWPGMQGGPYKKVKHPGTKANPYIDTAFRNMMPDINKKIDNFHKWLVTV